MSVFCDRLRLERKRLSLSQADFAALAGVTVDSQGNYERGTRKPDTGYLEAIARHGVDVAFLLTGVRAAPEFGALSQAEASLLLRFRGGSPVLRAYLEELAVGGRGEGNSVQIGGDVGQSIAGDASFSAPVKFSLSGKKKKD